MIVGDSRLGFGSGQGFCASRWPVEVVPVPQPPVGVSPKPGLAAEGNSESAGFVDVVPPPLRASGSHRSPAALAAPDASRAPRSRLVASDQSGSEAVSTRDAQPCLPVLLPFVAAVFGDLGRLVGTHRLGPGRPLRVDRRRTVRRRPIRWARGQARSGHRLSLGRRGSVRDGVITSAGTGRLHISHERAFV